MPLTLEALDAAHGDALLLHWGTASSPHLALVDGGPAGTWPQLESRLEALRRRRNPEEPLPIALLMVSHIDDDHIRGVLDLAKSLLDADEERVRPLARVRTLWHNSFDDLVAQEREDALLASLRRSGEAAVRQGAVPAAAGGDTLLVLASVRQGRRLRQNAEKLGWNLNRPFPGLVVASEQGPRTVRFEEGLSLTVVAPAREEVEALREEWRRELPEILAAEATGTAQAAARERLDRSVSNLSSLVVLAEAEGRRVLLTGDARGDKILEGLEQAGLLPEGGELPLDLLKIPHHGSARSNPRKLFERLPAEHYVVSGDGRHDNPEIETLERLSEARGEEPFTLWLTHDEERLRPFFAEERARDKRYEVKVREEHAPSLRVDLGGEGAP